MRLTLERLIVATVGLVLATLIACGSESNENDDAGYDGGSPSGTSSSGGVFGDGGRTEQARGVILVHGAAFPSMRVCFSGYPELPPQPDRDVLPQANILGIDTGGLVRLGPMTKPPGEIYVIPQKVKAVVGATEKSCGEYIKNGAENFEYYKVQSPGLDRPIGVDEAEVIAIVGCGPTVFLGQLGLKEKDCPNFDSEEAHAGGTFEAKVLTLTKTTTATDKQLPMTLINLSAKLSELAPSGQELDVTFGDFDAGATAKLATDVPAKAALFAENESVTLDVDQSTEATFGMFGFRIAYRDADGTASALDAGGFVVDQSLATIQESSRSTSNPTSYYVASSNFAFFLLGDPSVRPVFADGGTNPYYARRAVHMLAVPVRDDSYSTPLADAGADEANANNPDAGADASD